MPDKIHLTVAALVCHDNHFLCVSEVDQGRAVINQPAGHVEPGESLIEAVEREALEETGWSVRATAVLGIAIYTAPTSSASCSRVTYYRVNFACDPIHHNPHRALDPDIAAVLWLSPQQLRERHAEMRSPLVLKAIDDHLSGRRYPLGIIGDYR
ncbi:MAG: NUDIX hydrolase [Porticoccaceae bacterium]